MADIPKLMGEYNPWWFGWSKVFETPCMQKYENSKFKKGIVISKNTLETNDNFVSLPLSIFLMLI